MYVSVNTSDSMYASLCRAPASATLFWRRTRRTSVACGWVVACLALIKIHTGEGKLLLYQPRGTTMILGITNVWLIKKSVQVVPLTRKSRYYETEAKIGITKTECTKPRETLCTCEGPSMVAWSLKPEAWSLKLEVWTFRPTQPGQTFGQDTDHYDITDPKYGRSIHRSPPRVHKYCIY